MIYSFKKVGDSLQFSFHNRAETSTADYYCSRPLLDNFLFVNVPKCATQTIHAWAMQLATRDGFIAEPFRFTVLREPYGRLKSTFAYGIGAKYYFKFNIEEIGDWFLGKNLPDDLTPNHCDLLTHFVPQKTYVDNSPIPIDHWYHTGTTRELRQDLSHISGKFINWELLNVSRYTREFTVAYNEWFTENEDYIVDYLQEDCDLYYSRFQL